MQGCIGVHRVHTKCTVSLTFLSVKLESWNLVCRLEFVFHKLFYTSYFEKIRCAVVHSGAEECTGCTKCTFSLAFLSAKLESWNLVWMLEFEFHKLSYKPYFEKQVCSGAQWCTGVHRVHKVHIFPSNELILGGQNRNPVPTKTF